MPTGIYQRKKGKKRGKRYSYNKGIRNPMYGKKHTEETKNRIGKTMTGKKHTEESKRKVSQNKERAKKISQALKGKSRPWEMGEKNPSWKGGISFEPYPIDWTETLKRAIRERDNYICQLCSQYGNIIHHKDYNKKNCNPNNLTTLCHKCHLKTNLNRKYWENYF